MGVGMCSTGSHILWISVGRPEDFRSYSCDCPPYEIAANRPPWSNVTPRVNNPMPGYDFIRRGKRK